MSYNINNCSNENHDNCYYYNNLVKALMRTDPKTRLTVAQALAHRWLNMSFAAPKAAARMISCMIMIPIIDYYYYH